VRRRLEQHQPDWNSPADKVARENKGLEMITPSGQRFVGVSQADKTRGERSKRVNHAIKQYSFRNSRFNNLPAVLRGKVSTNTTFFGSL
jgi:hypothetical protein